MKEQLIKFETAELAKKKGFEINSNGSYDLTNGVKLDVNHVIGHIHCKDTCSIATQSLLQKWLREKHNIHIAVVSSFTGNWAAWLYSLKPYGQILDDEIDYESYENALEKGLFEALKLIKL